LHRPRKTPRTTRQYRDPSHPQFSDWKKIARAYVVTKALSDFGEMEKLPGADTRIMKVPAPFLCYWIGQAESLQSARPRES